MRQNSPPSVTGHSSAGALRVSDEPYGRCSVFTSSPSDRSSGGPSYRNRCLVRATTCSRASDCVSLGLTVSCKRTDKDEVFGRINTLILFPMCQCDATISVR
ncbi:hypothetical protein EVAR_18172_1 [Eumeta japonica]|uniref:Uncharacterized protein n=1 Tax=Eumeta variegata TaxID=151549 RepID=A0A4C1UV42_EUMVA|nr:hypothetical protein EVAR_18172_1 [Eumeta japonica]